MYRQYFQHQVIQTMCLRILKKKQNCPQNIFKESPFKKSNANEADPPRRRLKGKAPPTTTAWKKSIDETRCVPSVTSLTCDDESVDSWKSDKQFSLLLILITVAATAQGVTSENTKGNFFCMYLGGAIAVTIAIYVSGGVSGGHLNPAYSLSLCVLGRFPWWKLPIYVIIQVVGSFVGAAAAFALYYDAIQSYTGGNLTVYGPRETASIFSSYPAPYLSIANGFLDQVMGTAMLMVGILAIIDSHNKPVPKGLEPIVVGLLVFSIGLSMGANCGYPINPSRDLGPRLFTLVAGWGPEVFRAGNNWWWVPIVAPCVGAVFGTLLYQILVAIHHPPQETRVEVPTDTETLAENRKDIPGFTMNLDSSLSHRL